MPEEGKKRTFSDHAAAFGRSARAVKGWAAIGRKAGRPCPLDDYALMPAWWQAVMSNGVPECITLAAKLAGSNDGKKLSPPNSEKETAQAARSIDLSKVEALTLDQNVDNLRRQLSATQTQLQEAHLKGSDDATISLLSRGVNSTLKLLRDCEMTLQELRISRGELVDLATVREDLQRVHGAMATSLESSLVDRLQVPRQAARAFVDGWFGHLRQSRFGAGTLPDRPAGLLRAQEK
jgi:hypothetical protein